MEELKTTQHSSATTSLARIDSAKHRVITLHCGKRRTSVSTKDASRTIIISSARPLGILQSLSCVVSCVSELTARDCVVVVVKVFTLHFLDFEEVVIYDYEEIVL